MGNDNLKLGYGGTKTISIHVPSWGTTHRDTGFNSNSGISIHVPSWGTTSDRPPRAAAHPDFNPRSLVGNDDSTYDFCALNSISIHVPSWGTTHRRILPGAAKKFQSTFPRGERRITARIGDMPPLFQSTFPRGERPNTALKTGYYVNFNPRSLVGNDGRLRHSSRKLKNFNPRSLVGNDGKFSQIFFVFLCNKYNFSTFYYPFSLFFSVIHVTFLIFVVRILPAFYVYF